MASPPEHPPSQYEPVGRWGHCSAVVDGKLYTYGGDFGAGVSPPLSMVEILDLEKWQQIPTTGLHCHWYLRGSLPVAWTVKEIVVLGTTFFRLLGWLVTLGGSPINKKQCLVADT